MNGTSFQKLVWRELLSIPPGETRTYKQIADAIGKPGSSRAVANACEANPYEEEGFMLSEINDENGQGRK